MSRRLCSWNAVEEAGGGGGRARLGMVCSLAVVGVGVVWVVWVWWVGAASSN